MSNELSIPMAPISPILASAAAVPPHFNEFTFLSLEKKGEVESIKPVEEVELWVTQFYAKQAQKPQIT